MISSLGRHSQYKQHAKGYKRKSVVHNTNPDFQNTFVGLKKLASFFA